MEEGTDRKMVFDGTEFGNLCLEDTPWLQVHLLY